MKIYDITQELFTGRVFPGDPAPTYERVLKIAKGDPVNLTNVIMGAHNATHLDAPYHFYDNGKTVEQLDLSRCIGECTVVELSEDITLEELSKILDHCQKRILIKGEAIVTLERAKLFNQYGILLIGVQGQSIGPVDGPMPVHYELLAKEVVLLEGLVLDEIEPKDYFLSAAPIKLGGSDGAPCRATLLDFSKQN